MGAVRLTGPNLTQADLTQGGLRVGERGSLLPLFLRFEPTTDPATLESYGQAGLPVPASHRDVVAYRDPALTDRAARWPWHRSDRPRKGARVVTLNCFQWRPEWRPALKEKSTNVENSA